MSEITPAGAANAPAVSFAPIATQHCNPAIQRCLDRHAKAEPARSPRLGESGKPCLPLDSSAWLRYATRLPARGWMRDACPGSRSSP